MSIRCALVIAALALAACTPAPPPPTPFPPDTPRLLVLIVVDQLSQEYLVRFRPLLDGGLARLLDNGVVFSDAHHDHAHTVTGAGHATLASGCFPRTHGIIGNRWYDRASGDEIYCVEGNLYSRSPVNLQVPALADWLDEMDPAAKVFAVSGKDRSAVLLGGHQADAALWYDSGEWVTTGYYREPEWLADFNRERRLDRYFGELWEPLPVPQATLDDLDIVELDEGIYQRSFPYAFGGKSLRPDDAFYGDILSSPFSDRYLMELATTLIREEELGADEHPDFLGIGFHALDYVGHDFGPNSREVLDTILRLDDTLGELLDFIDGHVGSDQVVVGLSADHGVAPMPSYRTSIGEWGRRRGMLDVACFQAAGRALRERFGDYEWLRVGMYLNDAAIEEAGIGRDALEQEIVALLGACESVERVWTRAELLATPAAPTDPEDPSRYRQLFANGFHPERSPDFEIQYTEYFLDSMSRGTTHGSPHPYDSWVPMIVMAPGVAPRQISERVRTIDLAPTLAAVMGIAPPQSVDGVDRLSSRTVW